MSENKCFCHFNGFEVKDAKARKRLEEIVNDLGVLEEKIDMSNTLTRVVDDKRDMTDENLIYVLIPENCWYYYSFDKLAWVNGGNFLIDYSKDTITFEKLHKTLRDAVTLSKVIDMDDNLETSRVFYNGKFTNSNDFIVGVYLEKRDLNFYIVEEGTFLIHPNSEVILEEGYIYTGISFNKLDENGTEILMTDEEIELIKSNVLFISNGGDLKIPNGFIDYYMLNDELRNLIDPRTFEIVKNDDTSVKFKDVITGGTITNNLPYEINGGLTDIETDETEVLYLYSGAKDVEIPKGNWYLTFTSEKTALGVTDELIKEMQEGIEYVLPEEEEYVLPVASSDTLGGVKVGENLSVDETGTLNCDVESYTLPTATSDTLGGVKVGNNISIDENGVLKATNERILPVYVNDTDSDMYLSDLPDGVMLIAGKWRNNPLTTGFYLNQYDDEYNLIVKYNGIGFKLEKDGTSYFGCNYITQCSSNYTTKGTSNTYRLYQPVNNLTTTSTGKPLDATQGKALNDKITTLQTQVNNLPTGGSGSTTLGENITNSSSITLSESFENYSEIDVYLKNDDETIKEKVTIVNPKTSSLAYEKVITYLDLGVFYMVEYMINYNSTTSISVSGNTGKSIDNDAITTISGDSIPTLYIEKVVGRN